MAPTHPVTLREIQGLLVVRRTRELSAELCRDCLRQVFWRYTLTTALLGWWGVVAMLLTPAYLVGNLAQLWASRRLPAPPPGAELASAVAERHRALVEARVEHVNARLRAGWELPRLADELAQEAGADPRELEVTLRLLAAG